MPRKDRRRPRSPLEGFSRADVDVPSPAPQQKAAKARAEGPSSKLPRPAADQNGIALTRPR
ncbi:hypothetical protein P4133_05065 [Pseudomonas aeruginosa]|nr:hypothetical protein [Pseudomonas aeruginosa]